jgi:penicillin-binding protein-related factor A (putative recombinase)
MRELESTFAKKTVKYLNTLPKCHAEKVMAHAGMRGKLDITGAINGLRFDIELKTYNNKPTPLQLKYLRWWTEVGSIAFCAWNRQDIDLVFKPIVECIKQKIPIYSVTILSNDLYKPEKILINNIEKRAA